MPVVLGLKSRGILLSPREFDAVEDFDERYQYELIDGKVAVADWPPPEVAGPNDLLAYLLTFRTPWCGLIVTN